MTDKPKVYAVKTDLRQQISEVEREIALRRNVYPKLVEKGRIKQPEADRHLHISECVLETLHWLQGREQLVRDVTKHADKVQAFLDDLEQGK